MRHREFLGVLTRAFEPFVHASVADRPDEAARHRGFIATHLITGFLALGVVPLGLVFPGAVPAPATGALALLGCEALVALYVSRTGDLARGHLGSALVLTLFAAWVALFTGGAASFALVWFAVAPLEAALSGRRLAVAGAAAFAVAGCLAVVTVSALGLVPVPPEPPGELAMLNAAAALLALLYGTVVALRVHGESRRAAARATMGERRYRLLADSMTDVVTCHGRDGQVTFASPAAERLMAVKPSALHGEGLFRRVHVADRPAYLQAVSEAIHRGEGAVEFRLRIGEDDTVEDWVWVEALMRRTEGGEAAAGAAMVSVTRDIGRRKLQEDELLKARQDAEAASFAKTHFLANMSHELRTPLNAIIGFSDLLGQEIVGRFENERQREYARLIKESGEHLLQMVNDILDMSKIEAGSFDVTVEPFDLAPVIERCRQLMQPQAEAAGVRIEVEIERGLPDLHADRRACRQILINLLSNAVKFSERGGLVVCGARREGRRLALFVKDEGIGIASEDLAHLGKPFFQADSGYDRRHEGTGLGLSVVKGLAALHGGTMTIESRIGQGTLVTVHLPIDGDRTPVTFAPRPNRRPDLAAPSFRLRRA